MDIIPIIRYEDGLEQLASLALKRELIPFFGAGFTSGCPACEGVVPDAKGAMVSMRDLILKSSAPVPEVELESLSFFNLSDLFFEYVSAEDRALYFEKNYTGVTLYSPQSEFLSAIDWPYAYTINIDDGIEKNSTFTPILPYRKLRRPRTSKKLLYKLHGDAFHESNYREDGENIIFSQSQYLQAITSEDNIDIYQTLLADYGQRHLLFIGCSLESEQDLIYVYQKSLEYHQDTYRIVLRAKAPSVIEQQNLKKHGINEIIIVDNFERFYPDFINQYKKLQEKSRYSIFEYLNPIVIPTQDKIESLKLLAGSNIFDTTQNQFTKGAFHVLRDAVNQVAENLKCNVCVILKGRRFSGKTYVLCSLTERFRTRDVFYFPSTTFADEEVVDRLLASSKNSLFLFDSNSITPDVYGVLIKSNALLEERNNKLVIAINSSDNYMPTQLKCAVVELSNQFHKNSEISLSRKALDSFGLTRRKPNQTNIDFLYTLKQEQNVALPFVDKTHQVYTVPEKRILFALCALDKLYYSDLIALNFSPREILIICTKLEPLIEVIPTSPNESTRHSNKKLVHNSKIALTEILAFFTEKDITDTILYIVKKFRLDYSRRRLYIEIILFDTLNQLFSGRRNSKNLITTIYAQLQPLLKDDLHYWLQRAKSIYRTKASSADLDEAYTYAKKAYLDGNGSLSVKAALTTALISCALSEFSEIENKLSFSEEAVRLAHEAVFSDYFRLNPNYLQAELPIGQNTHSEHRISNACNYVINYSSDSVLILKSKEILAQFELLQKNITYRQYRKE